MDLVLILKMYGLALLSLKPLHSSAAQSSLATLSMSLFLKLFDYEGRLFNTTQNG